MLLLLLLITNWSKYLFGIIGLGFSQYLINNWIINIDSIGNKIKYLKGVLANFGKIIINSYSGKLKIKGKEG